MPPQRHQPILSYRYMSLTDHVLKIVNTPTHQAYLFTNLVSKFILQLPITKFPELIVTNDPNKYWKFGFVKISLSAFQIIDDNL